ncbi:MAG: hypothetical protein IPK72_00005 [Candidatus Eisenbacteria bacterium]|nr:hypothetical protein [Candidatus Eisenbacteria bacterium]
MTTVRRVWGTTEGKEPRRLPIDLDLYVDSSGSMADPSRMISFPALAGAILCLSALRAGASGRRRLERKSRAGDRWLSCETNAPFLGVITAYFGAVPTSRFIDCERPTRNEVQEARPVHILLISDDGISTDVRDRRAGNDGWTVSRSTPCAPPVAGDDGAGTSLRAGNSPHRWEVHMP